MDPPGGGRPSTQEIAGDLELAKDKKTTRKDGFPVGGNHKPGEREGHLLRVESLRAEEMTVYKTVWVASLLNGREFPKLREKGV